MSRHGMQMFPKILSTRDLHTISPVQLSFWRMEITASATIPPCSVNATNILNPNSLDVLIRLHTLE